MCHSSSWEVSIVKEQMVIYCHTLLFCCCFNILTRGNLSMKELKRPYSLKSIKGVRGGTQRVLRGRKGSRDCREILLIGVLPMAGSATCLIQSKNICSLVAHTNLGPHTTAINQDNDPIDLPMGHAEGSNSSNNVPSLCVTVMCVTFTHIHTHSRNASKTPTILAYI